MEADGGGGGELEQAVEEWENVAEVVPEFRVGPSGYVNTSTKFTHCIL